MLSAFSENLFLSVKKEPCSDEELETEKRLSMDEDTAVSPVQDHPEDLSVKKKERDRSRSNSPRPSSISPPTRSCGSGSPDSQKNGEPSRAKRIKPIPPPLDLNARTLSPSDTLPQGHASLPQSPAELPRECLPIRKRQLVDVKQEYGSRSAGISLTPLDHLSPLGGSAPPHLPSTISVTPSSGSSAHHHSFTHFPVPPPLIPVPGLNSPYPKSPFITSNGFATPPSDLHSPGYPWTSPSALQAMGMFPAFSPLAHSPLPFPSSTLLSPAPSSYHSSSNSSREDLPTTQGHKQALTAPRPRYGIIPSLSSASHADSGVSSSSPAPSSPLLSPHTWSHSWPTPSWQCFVAGVMVRFLLPSTDTPWQKAEELGWKDKIAMKVDSRNPYRYAPNGLTVVKIDVISREEVGADTNPSQEVKTLLRLRMSPHNVPESSRVEMLAECPIDHPFFVKDKGWCSAHPRLSLEKYGIPCQDISLGDVCLPPNHPEAVRTPDLCDRFKKFEFSSQDLADQFSPGGPRSGGIPLRHGIANLLPSAVRSSTGGGSMMSPPMSPAKKNAKDPDKPKRPMNGFMLFAKKYRLELIQQHPGKDNRAISVLLGEAWKSLATEERDVFSQKAKVLADEQKKLHPDCWKRKRSLSSANQNTPSSHSSNQSPIHHVPQSPGGPMGHSMPPTPTRLTHPLSFLTNDRFSHPTLGSLGLSVTSSAAGLSLISVPPLEHNPR